MIDFCRRIAVGLARAASRSKGQGLRTAHSLTEKQPLGSVLTGLFVYTTNSGCCAVVVLKGLCSLSDYFRLVIKCKYTGTAGQWITPELMHLQNMNTRNMSPYACKAEALHGPYACALQADGLRDFVILQNILARELAREYKAAWLFPHYKRMLVGTASRSSYMMRTQLLLACMSA